KKPAAAATATNGAPAEAVAADEAPAGEPAAPVPGPRGVTIHVPSDDFGREAGEEDEAAPAEPAADGAPAPAKKKTRRGSRGGKNRKRPAAASTNGAEPKPDVEPAAPEPA